MAPKRKTEAAEEETTAREKKKLKVTAARTIAVQSVKAVKFSDNAVAGPSSEGPQAVNSEIQDLTHLESELTRLVKVWSDYRPQLMLRNSQRLPIRIGCSWCY